MTTFFSNQSQKFAATRFIFEMTKPYKAALFTMFMVAILWAASISVQPYLIKLILNAVAEERQALSSAFAPACLYVLSMFVMSLIFRLYNYFVEIHMIPEMRTRISTVACDRYLNQSHQFYLDNFSGSLANKVKDLVSSIPDVIQVAIDHFLAQFLAILIALYTMWQVNVFFALTMLTWIGIFLTLCTVFHNKLRQQADTWSELGSGVTGKIVDSLSNMMSIRLFSHKQHELNGLTCSFRAATESEKRLQWSFFWIWLGYGCAFLAMQSLNLYLLIKGRQAGTITVGDFALVLSINMAIGEFLWNLGRDLTHFSKDMGRITQALRSLQTPLEITDSADATSLSVSRGEITFNDVHFHYKGAEALFEKKSVVIKGGQKVGLVGYSGSGKTTFVNLILRLYDIKEGSILIDGQDIAYVSQESLRHHIGMIPQDPSLFHRSLMDNIRYGRPDASDEEVIAAAKKAYAHEFIDALPLKYESLVGERGVKLSGGQRQRIAIARAVLKNAPILILDEATSQLDSVTEHDIQESLWELMQNKTTLVIAHRLSTLLQMDRILVFDDGQIVEDGSHADLLTQQGMYKKLWDAQVGGFLPE